MEQQINNLKNEALAQIMTAEDLAELENLRISYLGRQGHLNKITSEI